MATERAVTAELTKLARTLDTTVAAVSFAAGLDRDVLRQLRDRISSTLHDEHRAAYRGVAQATKLLPTALSAKVAEKVFPPLLSARIAAELPPEKAGELAQRLSVDYLADICVQIDPRTVARLIARVPVSKALAVAGELVRRRDFLTIGRLLDAASHELLRQVATAITDDEALLEIGFYAESDSQLSQAVAALPQRRLRGVVDVAVTGPAELRSAGLGLMSRVSEDLRVTLVDLALEHDDRALAALVRTAAEDGALADLLVVASSMNAAARSRLLAMPALTDPALLTDLVESARRHDLWDRLRPLVADLGTEARSFVEARARELGVWDRLAPV